MRVRPAVGERGSKEDIKASQCAVTMRYQRATSGSETAHLTCEGAARQAELPEQKSHSASTKTRQRNMTQAGLLCEIDKFTGRARRDGLRASEGIKSSVCLGLQDLAAAIKTVRADVVTQMHFTCGRLDRSTRSNQSIVRTMHATLGRRLFVLLNGHEILLRLRWLRQFGQRSLNYQARDHLPRHPGAARKAEPDHQAHHAPSIHAERARPPPILATPASHSRPLLINRPGESP